MPNTRLAQGRRRWLAPEAMLSRMAAAPTSRIRPEVRSAAARVETTLPAVREMATLDPTQIWDGYQGQAFLDQTATLVGRHYGLGGPTPPIRFIDSQTQAGTVHLTNGKPDYIELAGHILGRPSQIAATLAHEFAHIWMAANRVGSDDTADNEIMTDCVAIGFGFGALMEHGCFPMGVDQAMGINVRKYGSGRFGYSPSVGTLRLGYLSLQELQWVRQRLDPRGLGGPQSKDWAVAAPEIRPAWSRWPGSWLYLLRRWSRGGVRDEVVDYGTYALEWHGGGLHVRFGCPACGGSMRLPTGKGRLRATCPRCRQVAVVRT